MRLLKFTFCLLGGKGRIEKFPFPLLLLNWINLREVLRGFTKHSSGSISEISAQFPPLLGEYLQFKLSAELSFTVCIPTLVLVRGLQWQHPVKEDNTTGENIALSGHRLWDCDPATSVCVLPPVGCHCQAEQLWVKRAPAALAAPGYPVLPGPSLLYRNPARSWGCGPCEGGILSTVAELIA